MSLDLKNATKAPLVDGDKVWGSDSGETAIKVMTDVVGRVATQVLTNKTLTAPVIATISNTGTLTLPTSTDTLVGRDTVDILTNKTLTQPTINTPTIATPAITAGTITNTALHTPTFANHSLFTLDTIAPSATISQVGGTAMTKEYNVITLATALYAVTMPTAVAGRRCVLINRSTTVTVYPASGDAINGGSVDAPVVIGGLRTITYVAIDATTWIKFSETPDRLASSLTLGAGIATFAASTPVINLTGDGAGNVVTTITGGVDGQRLVIKFVNDKVDLNHGTSTDQFVLSAGVNFTTSVADTVLELVHDGTHWHEVSRSINSV